MEYIESFTTQEAAEFFLRRRLDDADENQLFYNGDHLQERHDYRGYIGKKPPKNKTNYGEIMARIKEAFVSENVIKEIVDRHLSGILGSEPDWNLIPPVELTNDEKQGSAEQKKLRALQKEAVDALVSWWNDRNYLKDIFQEALKTCLLEEKVCIGAFIPPGFRDENDNIPAPETLREALDMIQFNVITSDKAGVFHEKEKYTQFGVYYTQKNGERYAELSWVNKQSETEFVVMNRNKNNEAEYEADPQNLNKRLYFYEMRREQLITEQVRSQQKALNLAWTKLIKNLNDAKIFGLNADPPDSIADGSSMTFLTGLERVDAAKPTQLDYKDPAIIAIDPVAVDTFIKARDKSYSAMLGQTHQRHVLKAEDAESSGKSQIEARSEYEKDLDSSKTAVDPLGRWFIDFSLRLAAALCGREADFENWRVDFNSIVDAGPVDAATSEQDRKDLDEGYMSWETYASRRNIEDPDAEKARLEASELYQLRIFERRLDVINKSSGVLTIKEKRKILYPDKTDAEIDTDLKQLAKEDAVIQAALG